MARPRPASLPPELRQRVRHRLMLRRTQATPELTPNVGAVPRHRLFVHARALRREHDEHPRRSPGARSRRTKPAFSIRSTRRVIPLCVNSDRSYSSCIRSRCSGASQSWASASMNAGDSPECACKVPPEDVIHGRGSGNDAPQASHQAESGSASRGTWRDRRTSRGPRSAPPRTRRHGSRVRAAGEDAERREHGRRQRQQRRAP